MHEFQAKLNKIKLRCDDLTNSNKIINIERQYTQKFLELCEQREKKRKQLKMRKKFSRKKPSRKTVQYLYSNFFLNALTKSVFFFFDEEEEITKSLLKNNIK